MRMSKLNMLGSSKKALLFVLVASALGCQRFTSPQEGGRTPFIEVKMVVPENFPTDRIAYGEIVLRAVASGPPFVFDTTRTIDLQSEQQAAVTLRPQADDPSRQEMVLSLASRPFKTGQRTATVFLYPRFASDAGTAANLRVLTQLFSADGRVLARGDTDIDILGQALRFDNLPV